MIRKQEKYVCFRHYLVKYICSFLMWVYSLFSVHYKKKSKYKIKKNEKVIILSNHQTDADFFYISKSFNKPIFPVATETLFSNKFLSRLLPYLIGAIPKKKGGMDLTTTLNMMRYIKNYAPVLLFIEGNRPYGEFQFYISPDIGKHLKRMGANIVLFNLHGGSGIKPRWGNKRRKGPFYGDIKRVIIVEEMSSMTDEELYTIIKDGLRVFDSEEGYLYKSNKKAEYLEREFFICPKCGKMETLHSQGNIIRCTNCGLEVEYKENLKLDSKDKSFRFKTLNDWYQYQKKVIKSTDFEGLIFKDDYVDLYISRPYEKRKLIHSGPISLTENLLTFGNSLSIDISEITSASPIKGSNMAFSTKDESYLIKGSERFNPLKYVLLFNKLETAMKKESTDKYYCLD